MRTNRALKRYASPSNWARIKARSLEERRFAPRTQFVSVMAYTFACLGVRQIAQSARFFSPGNERFGSFADIDLLRRESLVVPDSGHSSGGSDRVVCFTNRDRSRG